MPVGVAEVENHGRRRLADDDSAGRRHIPFRFMRVRGSDIEPSPSYGNRAPVLA